MELIITSPDDWPENWRELREIDTLLRCSICCEFMDTAMVLSKCSHSYCSLCIRRSICYKTQCPTCFVAAIESDLVSNRSLNDIIQKFTQVRNRLLDNVSASNTGTSKTSAATLSETRNTSTQTNSPQGKHKGKSLINRPNNTSVTQEQNSRGKSHSSSDKHVSDKKKQPLRKTHNKSYTEFGESDGSTDENDSDVVLRDLQNDSDTTDEDFKPQAFTPKTARTKRKQHVKSTSKKTSRNRDIICRNDTTGVDMSFIVEEESDDQNVSHAATNKNVMNFESLTVPKLSVVSCSTPKPVREEKTHTDRLSVLMSSPTLKMTTAAALASPSTSNPVASGSSLLDTSSPSSSIKGIKRVPCPVCGVEVPEKHINLHLDRCLSSKETREAKPPPPKRKPMPKLVYNLLKDKDLKKKCADIGLSTDGDRKALIKRHHDFTLLYNAECDSDNPKSAAVLIKQVQKTEQAKTKGLMLTKTTSQQKLVIPKNASSDQVQTAQKHYTSQHKSQFDLLIEEARKRRLLKKQSTEQNTAKSDKVEDENLDPNSKVPASAAAAEPSLPEEPSASTSSYFAASGDPSIDRPSVHNHDTDNVTGDEEDPVSLHHVNQPSVSSLHNDDKVSAMAESTNKLPGLPSLDFNRNHDTGNDETDGLRAKSPTGENMEAPGTILNNPAVPDQRNYPRIQDHMMVEGTHPEISFSLGLLNDSEDVETQDMNNLDDPNDPVSDGDSKLLTVCSDDEQNTNANNGNDDTEPLTESQLEMSQTEESDSEMFSTPESPSLLIAPSTSYMMDVLDTPTGRYDMNNPQTGKPSCPDAIIDNDVGVPEDVPKELNACTTEELTSLEKGDILSDFRSGMQCEDEKKVVKKRGRKPKKKQSGKTVKENVDGNNAVPSEENIITELPDFKETAQYPGGACELETASSCTSASHTSDLFPASPNPDHLAGEESTDTRRRSSRRKRPRVLEEDPPKVTTKRRKQTSAQAAKQPADVDSTMDTVPQVTDSDLMSSNESKGGKKPRGRKK